jgi:ferredoxin
MVSVRERHGRVVEAILEVIPDVVYGAFTLTHRDVERVPEDARNVMAELVGWTVFVYALPITDDGLSVWHNHGRERSLLANYVLSRARDAARRALAGQGRLVVLSEFVGNGVSMVEIGELAGIGSRGWNNLLLHPVHGGWLQIDAFAIPSEGESIPDPPRSARICIECGNCIVGCPAHAISNADFLPASCANLVASPWNSRSRAVALTSRSYIECRECVASCPIGEQPEGILAWRR